MVWFRVDDGFYSHPKTLLIPRDKRALAVGTWVLCGTWSASKRLDGFVPFHMLDEVAASVEGAEALVAVKLWRKTKQGYQFNNWSEFQPTRAEMDEQKEKDRVRKANYRATRNASKSAGESENVPTGQVRNPALPSRPVPSRKEIDITHLPETSQEQLSTSEDEPVSNPLVRKIVEAVHDGGVDIHPLVVPDIIAFVDERRGTRSGPVKVPERYYPTTIRHSWPEVQQFIYEKGLAS
jgi:hypothetical protein